MPINKTQLRNLITTTLKQVDLHSPDAVELLMLTAAQESRCGDYIRQTSGPAIGVFQMEPATYNDMWHRVIPKDDGLQTKILKAVGLTSIPPAERMEWDLKLAIIMARVKYKSIPAALPAANDLNGMAAYYKRYYNTELGAATVEEAMAAYKKLAAG